jgi:hypothetical protein
MKNIPVLLAGLILVFLLNDCNKKTPAEPFPSIPQQISVSTIGYSNLTSTSVDINGVITGGETVIARGVCWAKHSGVNVADNITSDGKGIGNFTSSITGLSPYTDYYIRTYAQTTQGATYGKEIKIRTAIAIPVVRTNNMTTIFTYGGNAAGTVTDAGGGTILNIGFCWSTTPNPTVSDNLYKVPVSQYTGDFGGVVSGLIPNTTYYLKALAINNAGTGVGNQITFKTNSEAISVQDYLPLQIGNYWEFSNGHYGGSILTDKIENLNGVDYYRLIRNYNPIPIAYRDTIYIRKTSNGIVYQRTKNSNNETVLFYLAASTGEVWITTNTNPAIPSYGNLSNKLDSVKRNNVVFTNCFRFEYYFVSKGNGQWEWNYWLAPNVGFVKFLPISPYPVGVERLTKSIINGVVQTY